jgi:hypothetical protein
VPTLEASWVNDGVSVRELVGQTLAQQEEGQPAPGPIGAGLAAKTFWARYLNGPQA